MVDPADGADPDRRRDAVLGPNRREPLRQARGLSGLWHILGCEQGVELGDRGGAGAQRLGVEVVDHPAISRAELDRVRVGTGALGMGGDEEHVAAVGDQVVVPAQHVVDLASGVHVRELAVGFERRAAGLDARTPQHVDRQADQPGVDHAARRRLQLRLGHLLALPAGRADHVERGLRSGDAPLLLVGLAWWAGAIEDDD